MEKYYLGLDVGTDSIGWAVTDEMYRIPRCKGNAMWGIRLLEGGKTAEERRIYRSARRRTERTKFRLSCLQMLFNEAIAAKDAAFFQRLQESSLYLEDKSTGCKYTVFNDENFTDKDFHRAFPTVYHLRKELIQSAGAHDVRLVYLAIAHIIKHRGHFLFDSDFSSGQSQLDFGMVWNSFAAYCNDNYDIHLDWDKPDEIAAILKDATTTKTKKKQQLADLLSVKSKTAPAEMAVITLLTGGTAKAKEVYSDESLEECESKSICLSSGFDEHAPLYESAFGERFELLEQIKAVYDWTVLSNILQNQPYLSFAKVETYEKHKADLRLLKAFVKQYCEDKKSLIFSDNRDKQPNYLAYSGHSKKGSPETKNCTQEAFCEFLKKQLPKECPAEKYEKMYAEIENSTFMPKAVSKDNAVIPMQVQKLELEAILRHAEGYLPFLKDTNEDGKTVSQMIMDIFSFRIPYYVGPLNRHSDKHWLCRTDEKIYPWNFEKVVDIERSAENFIQKLTSKCTYLPRENVIPRCSLLYSTFMVLNDLNNVRVDGQKLPVALKQEIYRELFMNRNKVTQKGFINYLKTKGYGDVLVSGIDGDFKSNLKVYRDFGTLPLTETEKESIVAAITIFGEDKALLKRRLRQQFGKKLSPEDIRYVCGLKYTGWSRFSRKFLAELEGMIGETGEVTTIIRALWGTSSNLMQLLSKENTFSESIERENGDMGFTSLREEVENLYVSPKIKRPIYQTLKITEELVALKKQPPAKIFVEVARGEEEKVRTVSRKKRLEDLYKAARKQEPELYAQLEQYSENDLRRDALYLYFTQFGRCMYTGTPLQIEDIFNKNICDIDHIFPQSKIKDDSLHNRVLVLKTANEAKSNRYPIVPAVRQKMISFWSMLLEKECISKTKYERLVRATPLSDEELSGFISRQLVETRQSTKALAEILKRMYRDTEIVYVKAGLVSNFRTNYDMLKCRAVNDLHHAKDAYLNIVVGNVYNTQFNHNRAVFLQGLQTGTRSVQRLFDYPINGAWVTQGDASMATVKKTMAKNNILFTRFSYCQQGGLFDQNILKKGHGQVPIKEHSARSDIEKYGGYNRPTSTYFSIASYTDKKGKPVKIIVPIDLYNESDYRQDPAAYVAAYLRKNVYAELDDTMVRIIVPCVKYNALISVNGFRMHISSKSSGGASFVCKPAVQLVVDYEQEKYIKAIDSYQQKCKEKRRSPELSVSDPFTKEKNMALYDELVQKTTEGIFSRKFASVGDTLKENRQTFASLEIVRQCAVLMQILSILHANVCTGDLTAIGGAGQSGVTSIGNKIVKSKKLVSFKLIHQSVTGLYETQTELID